MAKEPGFPFSVVCDDDTGTPQTISNDVTNLDFATPRAVQDVTGVDKAAMERLLLLADFSATLNGVWNDGSNASHDVFSGDLSVVRTLDLSLSGQKLSNEVLLTDYRLTRAANGAKTWAVPAVLADGTVPTWTTT